MISIVVVEIYHLVNLGHLYFEICAISAIRAVKGSKTGAEEGI